MSPEDARRDFVLEALRVRDAFGRVCGKLYESFGRVDEADEILGALRDLESAYSTYRLHATREQMERG